jgi:hypothetical protein
MANEPDLPIGTGRFGSLIPASLALFRATWDPQTAETRSADASSQGKEDVQASNVASKVRNHR